MLQQIQKTMQTSAFNSLVAGYSNIVNSSATITIGCLNKIQSPNSSIVGSNNFITSALGSNQITGNGNLISGKSNSITGNGNNLTSDGGTIIGNRNDIRGNETIKVFGDDNIVKSNLTLQSIKRVKINGDSNVVKSNDLWVTGNRNLIEEGVTNSYVFGDDNLMAGGFYIQASGSGSASIDISYLYNSYNLKIFGNENIIGTNSTDVNIQGSVNTIASNLTGIHLIGDSITVTQSSRMVVAQNREVDIRSKVLPCDLIQDYTPTGLTDSYGTSGYMTKDNNALWVKNNTGWREIPFNNTYASYYSTVTQQNPIANTVNFMTFSNYWHQNSVTLVDSSKIQVTYDGIYNFDFSAQLEKSGGGNDDIDIWFRYNGQNIDFSNTRVTLQGNNAKSVASWNFIQSMTASSYLQICWSSSDTGVSILSLGTQSSPTRPAIPSIILTVDKISNI